MWLNTMIFVDRSVLYKVSFVAVPLCVFVPPIELHGEAVCMLFHSSVQLLPMCWW